MNLGSQSFVLTDAELEKELPPRVLTVSDPRQPDNRAIFSMKERRFEVSEDVRPLIVHISLRGTLAETREDEKSSCNMPIAAESRRNALNQFCFLERSAQTFNSVICAAGISTQPPPSSDYNMSVTLAGIIDLYTRSGELTSRPSEDDEDTRDVLYSNEMKGTVKLMERMVNFNQDLEAFEDFRFFSDGADAFRQTGSALPLWRFTFEKLKKKQVTCVRWNPTYPDLFAVSYGSYEFLKQSSVGGVVLYTLKNPKFPEKIVNTNCTACCLDWNFWKPAILAVGLYDGSVGIIDARNHSKSLLFQTLDDLCRHSDPVWEVKWISEASFVSISADGRVCTWTLRKSKLEPETLTEINQIATEDDVSPLGTLNGLCVDFSPHEEGTYLVGTEEGVIYKYSRVVSSTPLDVFRSHSMAVYAVKWSPFSQKIFLSASADWTVKIWSTERATNPVASFDLLQAVGDVDWSPVCSTVFGGVTSDGTLMVFDLCENRYREVLSHRVISKGKLTRVHFNAKEPVVLVGDDRGGTHCLKLSPNLRKGSGTSDQAKMIDGVIALLSD
jgi:dynein intermediate chain 1